MPVRVAGRFSLTVDRGLYEAVCNFLGEENLESEVKGELQRYVQWCLEEETGSELPPQLIEVFVEVWQGSRVSLFCEVPALELLSPHLTENAAWRVSAHVSLLTVRWLRSLNIWSEDLWPLIHQLIA